MFSSILIHSKTKIRHERQDISKGMFNSTYSWKLQGCGGMFEVYTTFTPLFFFGVAASSFKIVNFDSVPTSTLGKYQHPSSENAKKWVKLWSFGFRPVVLFYRTARYFYKFTKQVFEADHVTPNVISLHIIRGTT